MTSYSCKHLSNTNLLSSLGELVQHGRRNMAQLLAHLAEVNDRRLYLEQGCSSLFTYAVERLRFSEDEAAKRIHAARAAQTYPVIFELVAEGALHLSAVTLLAPHLTSDNHAMLLERARGKTKRQVEEIVAAQAPRPDSPARIWKLPSVPAREEAPTPVPESQSSTPPATFTLSAPITPRPKVMPLSEDRYGFKVTLSRNAEQLLRQAQALMRHKNPSGDLEVIIEQALEVLVAELERKRFGKRRTPEDRPRNVSQHAPEHAPTPAASPSHAPEHARTPAASPAHAPSHAPEHAPPPAASPSHAPEHAPPPAASPSHAPEHAPPPAASPSHAPEHAPPPTASSAHAPPHAPASTPRTRHIPTPIRRAVFERDAHRCSFLSPDGHRCSERGFLELHHLVPFARGGASTVDGLQLRCRAHNFYEAELDFGVEHMRRFVESAGP